MGPIGGENRSAPTGPGTTGGTPSGPADPPPADEGDGSEGAVPIDQTARSPISVRTGVEADARRAAELHAGRITEGFLSFLGPSFLTRLYRRICRSPHGFLLVAVADSGSEANGAGEAAGFVAGSTDLGHLYRSFLWHDGLAAALAAAPRLLSGWRRVAETLRHGASTADGTGRGAELLAIAVDAGRQTRGVGTQLVSAFLDQVTAQGGEAAYVVVAADNPGAIRLYERAGFVLQSEFELHAGTTSLLLQWDRPTADSVPGAPG